jgi:hypothetical protein
MIPMILRPCSCGPASRSLHLLPSASETKPSPTNRILTSALEVVAENGTAVEVSRYPIRAFIEIDLVAGEEQDVGMAQSGVVTQVSHRRFEVCQSVRVRRSLARSLLVAP